jgi:signal transduction histidine kinase
MTKEVNINQIFNRDIEEYKRLSSMLSKSVHDINNPLAVFIGQISIIELLQKRGQLDDEKMEKIIEKFKSSSETLKERIGRLRNFYKVPINDPMFGTLENAVNSACYIFENETYLAGITYTTETISDINVDIPSNNVFLVVKHLVQNAVDSLLSNAKDGGNIHIKMIEDDASVIISVEDSGPGLLCDLNLAQELGYTTKANQTGGTGLALIQKIFTDNKVELKYEGSPSCKFSFILLKVES